MKKLEHLDLSANRFMGIPEGIRKQLGGLKGLYLSENGIERLPDDFGAFMPEIKYLFLNGNKLSYLPSQFSQNFQKLYTLRIQGNQIKYIVVPFAVEKLYKSRETEMLGTVEDGLSKMVQMFKNTFEGEKGVAQAEPMGVVKLMGFMFQQFYKVKEKMSEKEKEKK